MPLPLATGVEVPVDLAVVKVVTEAPSSLPLPLLGGYLTLAGQLVLEMLSMGLKTPLATLPWRWK